MTRAVREIKTFSSSKPSFSSIITLFLEIYVPNAELQEHMARSLIFVQRPFIVEDRGVEHDCCSFDILQKREIKNYQIFPLMLDSIREL